MWILSFKALIPSARVHHHPKASPPNTRTLQVSISTHGLGSVEQMHLVHNSVTWSL